MKKRDSKTRDVDKRNLNYSPSPPPRKNMMSKIPDFIL